MKHKIQNIITKIADVLLLTIGIVIAMICSACNIRQTPSFENAIDVLFIVALCFLGVIVIVEIISVIKISDSTAHTVLIAISLFCYIFFSDDFDNLLRNTVPKYTQLLNCIDMAAFFASVLSIIFFWNYAFGLSFRRKHDVLLISGAVVCEAIYVGLYFVQLQLIGYCLFVAMLIAVLCKVYGEIRRKQNADFSFYITEVMLCAIVGLSLTDAMLDIGLIQFSSVGFASGYGMVMAGIFSFVYVAYAIRADKAAIQAVEYKLKYETIKSEALRAQIKPHFIFNSLAAIQSLYHKSLSDGDNATLLFSRHLRANVEASNTDLIPFEKELDNIQVYVDLENMRLGKPFNVIFDIDFADFEVPVLSLQPYIENAMHYSRANENPDGYIRISSRKAEDGIELEITDNGIGFDVNTIPAESCGIRNSKERFSMLMGIEPRIDSMIGQGTTVKICIPTRG